jgi:hypothetical protein
MTERSCLTCGHCRANFGPLARCMRPGAGNLCIVQRDEPDDGENPDNFCGPDARFWVPSGSEVGEKP